jgi:hypothetical protein
MPLANSTDANTAAPNDTVPVSCSVTLLTKLRESAAAEGSASNDVGVKHNMDSTLRHIHLNAPVAFVENSDGQIAL